MKYLTLLLLFIAIANCNAQNNASIVKATKTFLQTLDQEQLKKAQRKFDDTLRYKWSNFPVGMVAREGVRYGDLSDKGRIAFHDMLSTILSSQGYLKVTGIMQLDDVLGLIMDKGIVEKLQWNYQNYFISIWGTPDEKEYWSFNFGGHHLALTLTMHGKDVSFTPLFVGTDPSQPQTSQYAGWRVLSKEEDYGFMLLNMLSKEQQAKAILKQEVPKDIITSPNSSQRITSYYGISGKEFNKDQVEVFKILIQEYLHNFEHNVAHGLYDEILKNGFDKVYFAWVGSSERHAPHYYIINSPDFLIEYDNVGFQNDGNHIHAILREKDNDFGADLLKDHYLNSAHHKN
ncbi:MAG: DUF3500 domain-containing protein [Bacteroidota bacterium]